jgi:hypothetical protein
MSNEEQIVQTSQQSISDEEVQKDDNVEDVDGSFVDESETENTTIIDRVFEEITGSEGVIPESLKPTFVLSAPKPFSVRPKGQSKTNVSKGKRPRNVPLLGAIQGELLSEISLSNNITHDRQWYEHALKSQLTEKLYRTKNTVIARIEEMNQKNLISLVNVYKIFQEDKTPIGVSTPSSMSRSTLSNLLKVDQNSNFITTILSSLDLQDTVRKTLLDVKKLPTCGCGYIYVHPTVTFSKNLIDHSIVVGKQPGQDVVAIVPKIQAVEYLNALRYFLEIVYERLNN